MRYEGCVALSADGNVVRHVGGENTPPVLLAPDAKEDGHIVPAVLLWGEEYALFKAFLASDVPRVDRLAAAAERSATALEQLASFFGRIEQDATEAERRREEQNPEGAL